MKYYQEEKLGLSSAIVMQQSRLYSGEGLSIALPTSLMLAYSTLAKSVYVPGLDCQDFILPSVRGLSLLLVSELLRTGMTRNIGKEEIIKEVMELMEILGIDLSVEVVRIKVGDNLHFDNIHYYMYFYQEVKACINEEKSRTKWEEGASLGQGHSFSGITDFSQVLEVSSESDDDFSDFDGKMETKSSLNYKLKNKSDEYELMLERISESGANLRKRSRMEEILRSGSTKHSSKRMKMSSRDPTKKCKTLNLMTPSAGKFSHQRSCGHMKKENFVVLEVSSDTDNASEAVDENQNDHKDARDDGKTESQQLVRFQSMEGKENERVCAGGSTESVAHDSGAEYPSSVVLSKLSGPADFLWQVNKEEFLAMFGLCSHAKAAQIRASIATAVPAGPSRTRVRRCRKVKVK